MDGQVSVASLFCGHGNNGDNSNPHNHSRHRKRTHEQMSRDNARPAPPRHRHTDNGSSSDSSSSSHFRDITNNLRIPIMNPQHRRNFDLRRPANMATRPPRLIRDEEIIDLTNDNQTEQQPWPQNAHADNLRPPVMNLSNRSTASLLRRNPRPPTSVEQIFIDLSDDEDSASRPQSPEIEFIRSRTRSRSVDSHAHHRIQPDAIVRTRGDVGRWVPAARLPHMNAIGTHLERIRNNLTRLTWERFPLAQNWQPQMPQTLDFQSVGFDLANPQQEVDPPTYDAPPPPKNGFTRSSTDENTMMICPNCDLELGAGNDDEQRQVWAVKACGHVYCGKCVANRSPRKKKGSQSVGWNGKPFSKCVVDDCGKVVDKRNLVQIYL